MFGNSTGICLFDWFHYVSSLGLTGVPHSVQSSLFFFQESSSLFSIMS